MRCRLPPLEGAGPASKGVTGKENPANEGKAQK